MMAETIDRLGVLQAMLRAPLGVTEVKRQGFHPDHQTVDEVIVTHRFIVIEHGGMDYAVDGVVSRVAAGEQFFVPAWSRREWRVARGGEGCRMSWCEFSSEAVSLPPVLCRRSPVGVSTELAALARFWPEASAGGVAVSRRAEAHPEVVRAMAWLEKHFAEPDALERFYRTVALSPNHFRLLFRRHTGETVQGVLSRLRLRRARYLVRETSWPMKRIAIETGFADPLYFSSQYKRFWGRAASGDRAGVGVA